MLGRQALLMWLCQEAISESVKEHQGTEMRLQLLPPQSSCTEDKGLQELLLSGASREALTEKIEGLTEESEPVITG